MLQRCTKLNKEGNSTKPQVTMYAALTAKREETSFSQSIKFFRTVLISVSFHTSAGLMELVKKSSGRQ